MITCWSASGLRPIKPAFRDDSYILRFGKKPNDTLTTSLKQRAISHWTMCDDLPFYFQSVKRKNVLAEGFPLVQTHDLITFIYIQITFQYKMQNVHSSNPQRFFCDWTWGRLFLRSTGKNRFVYIPNSLNQKNLETRLLWVQSKWKLWRLVCLCVCSRVHVCNCLYCDNTATQI